MVQPSEADDILGSRGIVVVPDVICNSGGVTVSYFEWVQDFASYFWTEDEINQRLEKIVLDALEQILAHLGTTRRFPAHSRVRGRLRAHPHGHEERGLYLDWRVLNIIAHAIRFRMNSYPVE